MAFGFLKAPFKLITAPARFVAKKVVAPAIKFVARNPEVILGTLLGGVPGAVLSQVVPGIGGGGGGGPPPLLDVGGRQIVEQPSAYPGADRFSLSQTIANFLAGAKREVEEAVSQVTVRPRLSGPMLALVAVTSVAGVVGLVVALQKK